MSLEPRVVAPDRKPMPRKEGTAFMKPFAGRSFPNFLENPIGFGGLLRRVKIRHRLIVSFSVLTLVPLLITAAFAYQQSTRAIKSKISTYSMEVMNQVSVNIRNDLVKFENDSVDIAFSDLVQNTLENYDRLNDWEKKDAEFQMQKTIVKKFALYTGVTDVLIYTADRTKLTAYGDTNFKLQLKEDFLDALLDEAHAKNGVPVWSVSTDEQEENFVGYPYRQVNYGENGILLARSFKSIELGAPIGYLVMRIDERHIAEKFSGMNLGTGSNIFILNESGTVISADNPDIVVGSAYPEHFLIEALKDHRERGELTFNSTVGGKPHLIAYAYIPGSEWYVVSTIPYTYLNNESVGMWHTITFLGLLCTLIALYLSYVVSRSISRPMLKLINSMNNLKKGHFVTRVEDHSTDELGVMTAHFNTMVGNLQSLIEEVKSQEKQKRLAELKALQAQINPHFLSNTLNTVKWMADMQKASNISDIITSLIQLLHGSMGKGGEWTSVRGEIEYVKNYLNIMEYHFANKFRVHFELEEDILDCRILKFVLQPLVENALLHGLQTLDREGWIVVKGYRDGDELILTVTDNGKGMPEDALPESEAKRSARGKSRLSGIGIRNVDNRIKLHFGMHYGVSIKSVPDLFTSAEIVMPVITEEEGLEHAEGAHRG